MITRTMILLIAVCAQCALAQTPTLSSPDTDKRDSHDRPVGHVKMKLPLPAGMQPSGSPPPPPPAPNPVPPPVGSDVPPTETPAERPAPDDPPTFFDEPAMGKMAFILDRSQSMHGCRIASLLQEMDNLIPSLTDDDWFDFCAYSQEVEFMWGDLRPATEANRNAALAWLHGPAMQLRLWTGTYGALKLSCERYPADLDKMFVLTDGRPNRWQNQFYTSSQILADFPAWFAKFSSCQLVCVCIGGNPAAESFMQQLAALGGGICVMR